MSENINISLIVIVCLVIIVIMMLVRLLKQRQEYSQAVSKSRIIKKDKEVLLNNIDEFVSEKENETQLDKLKAEMQFEEIDPEPPKGYNGPLNVYRAITPDTEDADKESFVDFGLFVEMPDGYDALLHISKVAKERVNNLPERYKEGDMITVVVMEQKGKKVELATPEFLA